jgi:hypothetical protein
MTSQVAEVCLSLARSQQGNLTYYELLYRGHSWQNIQKAEDKGLIEMNGIATYQLTSAGGNLVAATFPDVRYW